jgi:hypothetical protein
VPIVGAGRVIVEKIVDARKLHFDRACHSIGHHLGASARIVSLDLHHRGRDLWVLGHGQDLHGHKTHHHDHDGEDRGEDRAVDEKAGAH